MEADFHSPQIQIWRVFRQQREVIAEIKERNKISQEEWVKYLTELFDVPKDGKVIIQPYIRHVRVTINEVETTLKSFKKQEIPRTRQINENFQDNTNY